jgi:soluble lytic murein transglycosylase-like protein
MSNEVIIALIISYAKMFGVDPNVAVSVAKVESKLNVNAVGSLGEIGLFQIRPEFQPKYTKKQLFKPETNIAVGVSQLAKYQDTCVHRDDINYLVCYNFGPSNAKKVKYPHMFPYVKKVRAEMKLAAYPYKRFFK